MGKLKERPSLPRTRRASNDRSVTLAFDPAVARIKNRLTDSLVQNEARLSQEEAIELPAAFDLQPLTRRRVSIRIASVKAATFQFSPEDEVALGDDNG